MILARLRGSLDLPWICAGFPRASSNGRLTTSRARVYTDSLTSNCLAERGEPSTWSSPPNGLLSIASIAALGVFAACGTRSTGNTGATGIAGCTVTITVATDLPTSGGDASDGHSDAVRARSSRSTQANANQLLGGMHREVHQQGRASVALGQARPEPGRGEHDRTRRRTPPSWEWSGRSTRRRQAEDPMATQAHLA